MGITVLSRLADVRVSRRNVVRATGILAVTSPLAARLVAAQEASPAASPHDAHAGGAERTPPEVRWTWSAEGVEIAPQATAGWNHVIVENTRDIGVHVVTAKLPDDVTEAQLTELADPEAPMPEWLLDKHFPGIPDTVEPDHTVEGYTFYEEGRYIWFELWSGLSGELVVGPGSATRHVPLADVTLTMVEMTFLGLENPLASGPQLWQVDNRGATWHEVVVARLPGPMTADDILEGLMADTWPDGNGTGPVAGYGITSPGFAGFLQLDLAAGHYAALCFAPDEWAGPPHALMGMITPFEVI